MKIHAILNQSGGTLKTADLGLLRQLMCDEFAMHGHEIEVETVRGDGIGAAIRSAAERADVDALLVGGGDGTVSGAAAALMDTGKALAVLPAGTMNLFARSLQIPLTLEQAVPALASGRIVEVDLATVNGKPFVHQYAVGLHARMVRAREEFDYGSRVGKMWATTRAIAATVRSLPKVRLEIEVDGRRETIESPAIAISNNVYGEGHLPYADDPQGGELGIYICQTDNAVAVGKLALDVLRGAWRGNKSLRIIQAKRVQLVHAGSRSKRRAVQDGELVDLDPTCEIVIRERALRVFVPQEATLGGGVEPA